MSRCIFFSGMLGVSLSLSLVASANDVTVFGADQNGSDQVRVFTGEDYLVRLKGTLTAVNDSIAPILKNDSSSDSTTPNTLKKWKLRTMAVGTGLAGQLGLGPVLSITGRGRFRLVYSNSPDPIFPD